MQKIYDEIYKCTHISDSIYGPYKYKDVLHRINTYVNRGKCSFSLPVDERQEKEE